MFKRVAGKTNDGDRLGYNPTSVKLNGTERYFQYAVYRPNGEVRINNATTLWCRRGKVEYDFRGYDGGNMHAPISKSLPGWHLLAEYNELGGYIVANSTASKNFRTYASVTI